MALIRLEHLPETVKVNLPLNIILPDPGMMKGIPVRDRKVLYLLHGLSDDASAWQRYSPIEILARHYGLVVVMPSVGRSFYADMPNGQLYFTYLTEELPRYLHEVFGIIPRRENTLIAGLSMGGYGAFKAAFACPDRYYAAASFSGVLGMELFSAFKDDPRNAEFVYVLGDLSKISGSEHDPAAWLQRASQNPSVLPRLFATIGRQEDLYPLNLQFKAACQSLGVSLDYYEEDGQHDWLNWNRQIERFLSKVLEPLPV
ncbi:MAG: esterase family protein [Chloroflexi bacterium]|nr:MAG: esterase family protein [Chloroflexota bacterium]